MDRKLIYLGQIPLETDLLGTNKQTMIGIAKLCAAIFGTSTFVNGLSCGPTAPASMQVSVGAGEIYSLQNMDDTAYSSLAADTTHQILKQGILLDAATINCPAPGTAGYSINYLVQATFSEVDQDAVALPYYNSSNPAQAWTGPNNNGATQYTTRADKCVVTAKAGTAATTGSQTTPAPDAGNVGLYVVTVDYGQTTILAGDIVQYTEAPVIPLGGASSNVHNALYSKSVAGGANVTLAAQEAAYPIIVLTGALTANISVIVPAASRKWIFTNSTTGAYTVTVKTASGTGVIVEQGTSLPVHCDGVNVIDSGGAYARLGNAQTFTKAQRGAVVTLTDGATITPDFALSNNYEVTLAGNRTLANPTNIVAGQSGVIKIAQDATGSRTLAFGSYWKFEGGSAPTLTTTASAVDDLVYYVESATRIVAKLLGDTK